MLVSLEQPIIHKFDKDLLFCILLIMDITINTPALFFPAISLVMLAYTNRFLALASVVRNLHSQYNEGNKKEKIHGQIKNLKYRLRLVKNMQAFGVLSFLCCIFSMYFIYINIMMWANIMFGVAMIAFIVSLIMSLIEIQLSTKALELELSDIEDLEDPSVVQYLKKKFERE
jgi:hypothetical protein